MIGHSAFLVIHIELLICLTLQFQIILTISSNDLSVIVRENRAGAKDRGRPFNFIFSQYKSYLKRLGMVAFAEVDVRFSSRNHHSIILGTPAAKNNRDLGQLCVTVKHTSYDS